MRLLTVMLAIALVPGMPVRARGPAPLVPHGRWTMTQEHLTCTVSLAYGKGATAQTLGFSHPSQQGVRKISIVSTAGYSGPSWRSDVMVAIGKAQAVAATASDTLQPDQRWLTEISPADDDVINPAQANSLTVRFGTTPPVTFTLTKAQDGVAMLKECQDGVYRKWGIDPASADAIASGSGPIGNPADWITSDDYPAGSLQNEEEGKTLILWHIGIDGLASDCRVVESSGHPLLDQAACDAIVRRARYAPALDKNRKPLPSWSSRNVVWSLPK